MSDRELLELAAKAAVVEVWFPRLADGNGGVLEPCHTSRDGETKEWNPLIDDGEALRLAVKLGIDVCFTEEDVEAVATMNGREIDGEWLYPWACESWTLKRQDPHAATRRAIVRAAAQIGKEMK